MKIKDFRNRTIDIENISNSGILIEKEDFNRKKLINEIKEEKDLFELIFGISKIGDIDTKEIIKDRVLEKTKKMNFEDLSINHRRAEKIKDFHLEKIINFLNIIFEHSDFLLEETTIKYFVYRNILREMNIDDSNINIILSELNNLSKKFSIKKRNLIINIMES